MTTLISLIKMFGGPAVSLNGSPTVSPMTAALCAPALTAIITAFDVFLSVVPAPPAGHEDRHHHATNRSTNQ